MLLSYHYRRILVWGMGVIEKCPLNILPKTFFEPWSGSAVGRRRWVDEGKTQKVSDHNKHSNHNA